MSMQQRIEAALGALQPEHLSVLDESHMHSRGLQTHFKAVVVSEQFAGLNSVKRHQKVYATLGDLMGEFHALDEALKSAAMVYMSGRVDTMHLSRWGDWFYFAFEGQPAGCGGGGCHG